MPHVTVELCRKPLQSPFSQRLTSIPAYNHPPPTSTDRQTGMQARLFTQPDRGMAPCTSLPTRQRAEHEQAQGR